MIPGSGIIMRTPPRPLGESHSEPDVSNSTEKSEINPNVTCRKRKRSRGSSEALRFDMIEMFKNMQEMFSDMIKEQKDSFDGMNREFTEIKKQNNNIIASNLEIKKSIVNLATSHNELRVRVEALEKKDITTAACIDILEQELELTQRKIRETTIEIRNLPPKIIENPLDIMKKIHKALDVHVELHEIRNTYRLPAKSDRPKIIVTEYTSVQRKNEIIKAIKSDEKFNTSSIGLEGEKQPIYISEQLTKKGKQIHYMARELVKRGEYKFCWSAGGKVFVRKEEGHPAVQIKSVKQIENLLSPSMELE